MDLPPEVHERAKRLAAERDQSLSATLADLTIRGLASLGEPATVTTDPGAEKPTEPRVRWRPLHTSPIPE